MSVVQGQARDQGQARRGLIDRYRSWLPVTDTTPVITLGEGTTPLVPAQVLSERLGCEVWLKVEGPKSLAAAQDEEFGPDNELLDDRYD
jgi:threonine synthase